MLPSLAAAAVVTTSWCPHQHKYSPFILTESALPLPVVLAQASALYLCMKSAAQLVGS